LTSVCIPQGLDGSPYSRFEDIVKQFQKVNHKALEDYVAHIKVYTYIYSNVSISLVLHSLIEERF
jgi:hypothetical protein